MSSACRRTSEPDLNTEGSLLNISFTLRMPVASGATQARMRAMRRTLLGSSAGIALAAVLTAAMVPLRSHMSIATAGLVLVVPVVSGVTLGGYTAGLISVAAGFLLYDFFFIPPYYTLDVGAAQNWIVLAVYAVVMVLVARVVAVLEVATKTSTARALNARRLFEVSERLVPDRSPEELARVIVDAVRSAFEVSGAALLMARRGRLEVAATSGVQIADGSLARLQPNAHTPVPLSTDTPEGSVLTLALATSGGPVGLLVLTGVPTATAVREVLPALANHLALALERAQMHERVRRAELLEEVDRLRHALVGAVSHDLRTPLATIKVASSTLVSPDAHLGETERRELYTLIDTQADRLTKIVDNVLDMTRIQAGVLEPRSEAWSLLDMVADALSLVRPSMEDRVIEVNIPPAMPLVYADHLLVEQALYNLIDNADRHGPAGTPITVDAEVVGAARVQVSVTDSGAGVPPEERQNIFDTFVRFDTGGRSGLGLAIARAFVQAHGERIWVEDAPGRGARFVFTLPVASRRAEAS